MDINIIDTNDNSPIFDQNNYQFTISEDALQGTIIGRIQATDIDTTSKGNGLV